MSKPWVTTVRVWDREAREYRNVKLAVTIDWNAVAAELAPKAMRNKSRKSSLVAGGITGKIVA